MVGRYRDDDRFLAHRGGQLGLDEVADLAATLADQPDDDHVAFGAGDHLAHQYRLADARPGDDRDALALAAGQQAVDRAHRSEERREGKECVTTCRSRWSPYNEKKNKNT